MILVTVGTQVHDFSRLLKMIEKLLKEKQVNEEVIIQSGPSKYKLNKSLGVKQEQYFSDFPTLLERCDLLITHGGVGTIIGGLNYNKKILAIPRIAENNEHVDNHQEEIVNKLSSEKLIAKFTNYTELEQLYEQYQKQQLEFNKYKSNHDNFNNKLEELFTKE